LGGGQRIFSREKEARILAQEIARRAAEAHADPAEAPERHHIFRRRHSAFKRGETRPQRAQAGDTCVSTGATKTPDRGRGSTERPRRRSTRDKRTAPVAARRTKRPREAVPFQAVVFGSEAHNSALPSSLSDCTTRQQAVPSHCEPVSQVISLIILCFTPGGRKAYGRLQGPQTVRG
jgi:hypothetical protein